MSRPDQIPDNLVIYSTMSVRFLHFNSCTKLWKVIIHLIFYREYRFFGSSKNIKSKPGVAKIVAVSVCNSFLFVYTLIKLFFCSSAHIDCGIICLQHPQRDFKPFEAPAAGSAAAQPQGPHGLWLVNIKHSKMNETVNRVDADLHW